MQKKVHFFALFCFIKKLGLKNDQKIIFLIISKPQLFNRQNNAIKCTFSVFFSFGHKIELRLCSVISKFWFGSVSVQEKQCRSYTFGRSVK